jgi:hypothetical protein
MGGSGKTRDFCFKYNRPVLCLDLKLEARNDATRTIATWLDSNTRIPDSCTLNVAGNRASNAPGIAFEVQAILIDVISKVNGTFFYPLQSHCRLIMPGP